MAVVYIIHSKKIDRFYIGSCKDFETRFQQHLLKSFSNSFTTRTDDWEIFLLIENLEYDQARAMEKHIKKMKSKVYIQNLLKYPEIINKLRDKYLGG